ncbi:MAG: glycosyltransferase family 4 protein [bacterium]
MRIAMLTVHPDVHSPLTSITPLLVSALRDLGCEVQLQFWGRRRERESLWRKILQRPGDIRRLRRLLRAQAVDLVLVHTAHAWATLLRDIPLLLAIRRSGLPVVLQFHGSHSDRLVAPRRRAFKLASALLIRLSDAALVLSSEEQRQWQRFWPAGRFHVVRNPFLPAARLDPAPLRARFSIAGDAPIVLFVGRLIEAKGLLDLVAVLAQRLSPLPWHLLVVGEGPLAPQVRADALRAGVDGRLTLTGYLRGEDLQAAYEVADVLVLPSRSEGFPLVILEAMAAGLPVVTTAIRGMADHLRDGVNALFVPPREPAVLATALTRLLQDGALRARLGEANRAKVREFSPDHVVPHLLAILRQAVATNRRASAGYG